MMAFSLIIMLLIFGVGAVMAATVVGGIASRKLWLIPAVAAGMFIGLIMLGLMASLFFGASRSVVVAQGIGTNGMNYVQQVTPSQSNFTVHAESKPSWIALGLIVFALVLVVRRIMSPRGGHGLLRAWPILAVLVFIAFMVSVRVYSGRERSQLSLRSAQEAAAGNAARQEFEFNREQSARLVKLQKEEQEKQRRALKAEAERQRVIAQGDIHELMNQFDQPRIPVSPEVPAPPSPPAPAKVPPAPAAPKTVVSIAANRAADGTASISVETTKADTKKPSTAAGQKRKKPKSPNSESAKTATQTLADTKANNKAQSSESHEEEWAAARESNIVVENPLSGPTKSHGRPAWVDQPSKRVGGGVQREVIVTDLWSTEEECERMRDMLLLVKVYEHLQRIGLAPALEVEEAVLLRPDGNFFSDPKVGFTHSPQYDRVRTYLSELGVTLDYARRETAKDEYVEKVDRFSSVGPMLKLYTLVEFSPAVDRDFRRQWEARERSGRFKVVGAGAGSLVALLGIVFGLLKVDTWTKGYYTKRLFIGVPLAIIGSVFMLAVLGKLVAKVVT